ncbi:MAG TPA: TIGR01906 family membrane protein, partial [Oceanobacillus sp.]|nr:TIGR01906 family membrane protein [Oceanobacillus sp.]
MVIFPVLLVLISARLVMSEVFLQFEYNRPGFPEDYYGMTREQRLHYAPFAVAYLLNGEGIDFLADLKFPDGEPLFNARELRHMQDVKTVTQIAFAVAVVSGLLALASAVYLYSRSRTTLRKSLFQGSILTLAIVAAIIIVAILNWNYFFTLFHTLFFESGTWYFLYSDSLIRLFPEQFWFDAALTIGAFTVLGALVTLLAVWIAGRDVQNG